jgi:hypothetical protein
VARNAPRFLAGDIGAPSVGNADFVVIQTHLIAGHPGNAGSTAASATTHATSAIQHAEATSQTLNRPDFQFMYEAFQARATRPASPYGHNEALAIVAGGFTKASHDPRHAQAIDRNKPCARLVNFQALSWRGVSLRQRPAEISPNFRFLLTACLPHGAAGRRLSINSRELIEFNG